MGYSAIHVLAGVRERECIESADIATADHLMLTLRVVIKRFADKKMVREILNMKGDVGRRLPLSGS